MESTTYSTAPSSSSDHVFTSMDDNNNKKKRKRRAAGTPDPEAEVVSLSPRTLLESERYICEICKQGFQRDQNLQMHRRRHKVSWKLLKRETMEVKKKRVFVCPEMTCLHHHPCHALGDLVGIKKHFRRKHSCHKQWLCLKCSKAYAVHSDYKAHLKTCGTRGHSCHCGRVFSRVESFIEHQDVCTGHDVLPEQHVSPKQAAAACSSGTASSTSPSTECNFSTRFPSTKAPMSFLCMDKEQTISPQKQVHHNNNLRVLQLLPSSSNTETTRLRLSIGSSSEPESSSSLPISTTLKLREEASEQLKLAMAEKAYAEDARKEAKRQIEIAETEFVNAKRMRQQAQGEVEKAQALKEQAIKKISSTVLQITCHACKRHFRSSTSSVPPSSDENSFTVSYICENPLSN